MNKTIPMAEETIKHIILRGEKGEDVSGLLLGSIACLLLEILKEVSK